MYPSNCHILSSAACIIQLSMRLVVLLVYAQNPLHTFHRNFPVDGEVASLLRTCCGLVSDCDMPTRPTSPQEVDNKS